jgi:hypothetical protein
MIRKIIAILLLMVVFVLKINAQSAVEGRAYAEVIAALTAFENRQLSFGKFSPEVGGGQIVITPEGVRTAQGSVILGGGMAQSGQFVISGQPEATYTIQLPDGPALLVHNTSSSTMTVDNWVVNPPAGTGLGTLTNGSQTVSIGATLTVGSLEENPVGIYTGTYSLTFAYN